MANIENDPKLRELCERASKEFDHERLMDLVKQINELLEKREQESGSGKTGDLDTVDALAKVLRGQRDRWIREWLDYQPLFIALAC